MRLLRFAVPVAGTLSLLASSSLFSSAQAHPNHHWDNRRAVLEQMPVVSDYPYAPPVRRPVRQPWQPVARGGTSAVLDPAAAQRRCNVGRLIGGLAGGGLGYAASRENGRAWAVPLGALLGSQVGCPVALGQGPLGGLGF